MGDWTRPLRLRAWLLALDVALWCCGLGSPITGWVIGRASAVAYEDWEEPEGEGGEPPW